MKKGIIVISIRLVIFVVFITMSPANAVYATPTPPEVSRLQLEAQVKFFKDAIDKLGATSPSQVVDLYILGHKERNGVYQYSVLCNNLKEDFIKQLGESSKSFWIIGGSSPWLADYKLLENKKIDDNTYAVKIQLHWQASSYDNYEEKTLTIVNQKNKWCIKNITPSTPF